VPTFKVKEFSFGDIDIKLQEAYWANITSGADYPIIFNPDYPGIGLPGPMYDEYMQYFVNISTSTAVCDS